MYGFNSDFKFQVKIRQLYLVWSTCVRFGPHTCTLGWAKKYESVLSLELAWAHMPMGIEKPHTKFGPILFIRGSPTGCT